MPAAAIAAAAPRRSQRPAASSIDVVKRPNRSWQNLRRGTEVTARIRTAPHSLPRLQIGRVTGAGVAPEALVAKWPPDAGARLILRRERSAR
jgi:hypothetical protein